MFIEFFFCLFRLALAIPNTDRGRSQCLMFAVNFTEILRNGLVVADENWPTVPCQHGWEYDRTDIKYATIATEVSDFIFH